MAKRVCKSHSKCLYPAVNCVRFKKVLCSDVTVVELQSKPDDGVDVFTSPDTFPASMCGVMDPFNESTISEFSKVNDSIIRGDYETDMGDVVKKMVEMMVDKMRGKRGLVRRTLGSTRSSNVMRCVVTPSMSTHPGLVYLNKRMFSNAVIMKMDTTGMFFSRPIEPGDYAFIGRPPSNNKGSMTPVRVMPHEDHWYPSYAEDDFTMRVSISMCDRNNMDYDGDECYLLFPCREVVERELAKMYAVTWLESKNELVTAKRLSMAFEVEGLNGETIHIPCHDAMSMTLGFNSAANANTGMSPNQRIVYHMLKMKPNDFEAIWEYMKSVERVDDVVSKSMLQIEMQANSTTAISDAYELLRVPCVMMMSSKMVRESPFLLSVYVADTKTTLAILAMNEAVANDHFSMGDAMSLMCKFGMIVHQIAMDTKKHGNTTRAITLREIFTDDAIAGEQNPTVVQAWEAMTYCVLKDGISVKPSEIRSLAVYLMALKEVASTYDVFNANATKAAMALDINFLAGNGIGDVRYFKKKMSLAADATCLAAMDGTALSKMLFV